MSCKNKRKKSLLTYEPPAGRPRLLAVASYSYPDNLMSYFFLNFIQVIHFTNNIYTFGGHQ